MHGKQSRAARKKGYRSGLELNTSKFLDELKYKYKYEGLKIEWEDLAYRTYTPDFVLQNGIIVETKGLFNASDRRKHLMVKKQHPKLDIRFVFFNSKSKLYKGAKSTYADWCKKKGFDYADKVIPLEWLNEKGKDKHPDFIPFLKKRI